MRGLLVLAAIALGAVAWPGEAVAGYSHYWTWRAAPAPEQVEACAAQLRQLAEASADLVEIDAPPPGTPPDPRAVIVFNGRGDDAHEPFVFPGRDGFNFCKTAWKPYDEVVTAALLIMRDCFPPAVLEIESDGPWEAWEPGAARYTRVTGRPAHNPLRGGGMVIEGLHGRGAPYGLLGIIGVLALVTFGWSLFAGRGLGGGGASPATYYMFWLIAPAAIALVSAHPLVLAIVPIGLVARRWLPDPYLWLSRSGRKHRLRAQVAANAHDATARRQLAMLELEARRPGAALPLVREAQQREPDAIELRYLEGLCLLRLRRWQESTDALMNVLSRDGRFRYGEPYLALAQALGALGRWDHAEECLVAFVGINSSSVEGWCRLAQARRQKGDRAGAADAWRGAKKVYSELPGFQRRGQLGWYLRAVMGR